MLRPVYAGCTVNEFKFFIPRNLAVCKWDLTLSTWLAAENFFFTFHFPTLFFFSPSFPPFSMRCARHKKFILRTRRKFPKCRRISEYCVFLKYLNWYTLHYIRFLNLQYRENFFTATCMSDYNFLFSRAHVAWDTPARPSVRPSVSAELTDALWFCRQPRVVLLLLLLLRLLVIASSIRSSVSNVIIWLPLVQTVCYNTKVPFLLLRCPHWLQETPPLTYRPCRSSNICSPDGVTVELTLFPLCPLSLSVTTYFIPCHSYTIPRFSVFVSTVFCFFISGLTGARFSFPISLSPLLLLWNPPPPSPSVYSLSHHGRRTFSRPYENHVTASSGSGLGFQMNRSELYVCTIPGVSPESSHAIWLTCGEGLLACMGVEFCPSLPSFLNKPRCDAVQIR